MGMNGHADVMVDRLKGDDCYRRMFAAAFPDDKGEISLRNVTRALASFERTLLSFNAPYDRAQRGEPNALTASAQRGEALFFGARFHCSACHSGPNFTDATKDLALHQGAYHNIGLYDEDGKGAYPETDHGLRDATLRPGDEGKVRTPSLRNVALTGPYMHDGSVPDLALAVLRHYGPGRNRLRDKLLDRPPPDALQTQDILAFLYALTDTGFVSDPRFSQPKA
jgi:cytochrome c peroxidase